MRPASSSTPTKMSSRFAAIAHVNCGARHGLAYDGSDAWIRDHCSRSESPTSLALMTVTLTSTLTQVVGRDRQADEMPTRVRLQFSPAMEHAIVVNQEAL